MNIHVNDFKWEKGKNDLKYIELLEKTLENEAVITQKAIAKIRKLSKENKEIRNKTIDDFKEKLLEDAPKNYAGGLELGGRTCYLSAMHVKKIAEQLKAGKENERKISNYK